MQESSRGQTRETEISPVDDDWEVQRRGLGLCCPGRLPGRGRGARALKDDEAVEMQRAEQSRAFRVATQLVQVCSAVSNLAASIFTPQLTSRKAILL